MAMGSPKVFRSKIDWWLILLALTAPGWAVATEWVKSGTVSPPPLLWALLAVLALIAVVFTPIRYVIEGRTVSVQFGLFRWEYAAFSVDDVQSVRPTHNPLASAALSLDRLNVDLGFRGNILISPKDKAGFLRALSALNPQLNVVEGALVRAA